MSWLWKKKARSDEKNYKVKDKDETFLSTHRKAASSSMKWKVFLPLRKEKSPSNFLKVKKIERETPDVRIDDFYADGDGC